MVCRSTPGNSAITTMARMQSGVDDVQVLSLFHEIRSAAPREYPQPTREEVSRFISQHVNHVTYALRDASTARRESILRRFGDAATAALPDGRTFYAWQQITNRSVAASGALRSHFDTLANRGVGTVAGGWDRAEVENRFRALVEENRRAGRGAPTAPENPAFSTDNLPQDRATRYALAVLHGTPPGTRLADIDPEVSLRRAHEQAAARAAATNQCDGCGQFAGDGHTCAQPTQQQAVEDLRERLTGERRVASHIDSRTGQMVYTTPGGQQFANRDDMFAAALDEVRHNREREAQARVNAELADALANDTIYVSGERVFPTAEERDAYEQVNQIAAANGWSEAQRDQSYEAGAASRRASEERARARAERSPEANATVDSIWAEARARHEAAVSGAATCPNCGRFADADHTCPDMELNDGDTAAPAPAEPTESPLYRAARELRARRAREAVALAEAAAAAAPVRRRTALRTYSAGETAVQMTNRSQVLADVRGAGLHTPVSVNDIRAQFPGEWQVHTVRGSVDVTATSARSRRGQDRLTVATVRPGSEDTDGETVRTLRCTCPDYRERYDCEHVRQTVEAIAATLNDRDAVAVPVESAVTAAHDALRADHDSALAAQQGARAEFAATATGASYGESMDAFQSAWDAAKERIGSGDTTIPYMTENATGGLGAREGGRSFGIEIEVDFPDSVTYAERRAVAREIYEAGLSRSPEVRGWHWANRGGGGYSDARDNWNVEFDRSVDDVNGQRGCEIVSPILYDTPETWQDLAKVCEIVQRHGGRATTRTGLHINVGAADYNHTVENHNRLLSMSNAYEDVLVRVAHNPQSGPRHRGRGYCGPAQVPAGGYRRIRDAQLGNGHRSMVNLDHVPAEGAPITNSTRVEVRIFDGAVDPGRIQTNVKVALGLVNAATRGAEVPAEPEPAGTHRARNVGSNGRARRLRGEEWANDTASLRQFADTIFSREEDKRQLVHAFAATRWQQR